MFFTPRDKANWMKLNMLQLASELARSYDANSYRVSRTAFYDTNRVCYSATSTSPLAAV